MTAAGRQAPRLASSWLEYVDNTTRALLTSTSSCVRALLVTLLPLMMLGGLLVLACWSRGPVVGLFAGYGATGGIAAAIRYVRRRTARR